jgi:hypothetical protein
VAVPAGHVVAGVPGGRPQDRQLVRQERAGVGAGGHGPWAAVVGDGRRVRRRSDHARPHRPRHEHRRPRAGGRARSRVPGTFHLGSTVVLVAPPGRWAWTIRAGDLPRVGRPIARAVS